jgi:hypothetical protein
MSVEPFELYGEALRSGLSREELFVMELLDACGVEPLFALNVAGTRWWWDRMDDGGVRLRSCGRPPRRIDLFGNEYGPTISSANLDGHAGS